MSQQSMKAKDSHQENIPIAVIGLNHNTADVKIREKVHFNEKQQTAIIKYISEKYNARSVVVLSTCNRTEIYLCGRKALKFITEICCWLDTAVKEKIFSNENIVYILEREDAILHFFWVISSLNSQIIGEPQITGQVKEAYEKSHLLHHTDALINKMYNFGMKAEKEVRSKTYLTDGAVSISFAGVELARKIFGNLKKTTVLLLGAGDISELAALHFSKGEVSKILVINRTFKKAQHLADKFQGEPMHWKDLGQALHQAQIVITATSSKQFIIDRQLLERAAKKRDYKPIFLIDLAVPRNVNPDVTDIDGVFLYNIDDLQEIVDKNIERRETEIPKAEKIIKKHMAEYITWYKTLPAIQAITQLNQHFEKIRLQEFERLKNRFPESSQAEAEYLSKSLMKKFLHHHIVTLRDCNKDPQRQKQHIDLVGEIYRLNGSESKNDKKN
jgi:glutamyl-tRNA reductase